VEASKSSIPLLSSAALKAVLVILEKLARHQRNGQKKKGHT
jgi:hypothetical protein